MTLVAAGFVRRPGDPSRRLGVGLESVKATWDTFQDRYWPAPWSARGHRGVMVEVQIQSVTSGEPAWVRNWLFVSSTRILYPSRLEELNGIHLNSFI
mmetsp:Transcript_2274/g.3911  ORF Transcript_2274/g.3911 Transcript_2274/m.3911 type:complete len:97 (-) Transcript_2274:492-782(-)